MLLAEWVCADGSKLEGVSAISLHETPVIKPVSFVRSDTFVGRLLFKA